MEFGMPEAHFGAGPTVANHQGWASDPSPGPTPAPLVPMVPLLPSPMPLVPAPTPSPDTTWLVLGGLLLAVFIIAFIARR
jgi:hypothetical protein